MTAPSTMRVTASLLALFASANGAPWEELSSSLSDETDFQVSNPDDWIDQCVHPFDGTAFPTGPSNYQLFPKASGLCQAHMLCAYEECKGPLPLNFTTAETTTYDASEHIDEIWKLDDRLNLPEVVVHPKHAGDVSASIKFAVKNQIGVSVKTSGHSCTGSSTKKGTILLNLSKLKKYSPDGSILECNSGSQLLQGACQDACTLAIARGKQAVVRAGGGEIFDELLGAVSKTWNENEANTQKCHVVSGAAGTVSAAGGWLASGGLSGNNGMRLYGLGVDQVLHVEMVLPSGVHVRFGPTEWVEDTEKMYPVTTKVTGYCNRGRLSDETSWDWQMCEGDDADIDFHGLWYAVRGGGGGTYGVVTSIYYQLHEHPSELQVVNIQLPELLADLGGEENDLAQQALMKWIEFIFKFFYDPTSIGVSETDSNSCSAASAGGFFGGTFFCFNGGGDSMKTAWETISNQSVFSDVSVDSYMSIMQHASYADKVIEDGEDDPSVPDGRAADGPKPAIFPGPKVVCPPDQDCLIQEYFMFPLKAIVENMDVLATLTHTCVIFRACPGAACIMGGNIPLADDGMNSLPLHRRHGGFLMTVLSPELRTAFERVFHNITSSSVDDVDDAPKGEGESVETKRLFDEDNFPGSLCHNHASADYQTPLKDDWTQACDPKWSKAEKMEKCFSFQETAWGTSILKKLEQIHTKVDPHRLFHCWDCVGYTATETPSVSPSVSPSVAPTPSSGDMPSGGPNTVIGVMMASLTLMLLFGGAW